MLLATVDAAASNPCSIAVPWHSVYVCSRRCTLIACAWAGGALRQDGGRHASACDAHGRVDVLAWLMWGQHVTEVD